MKNVPWDIKMHPVITSDSWLDTREIGHLNDNYAVFIEITFYEIEQNI